MLFQWNLSSVKDCDVILEIRLNLLHFQYAIEINDLELANDILNQINIFFSNNNQSIEIIRMPNQMYCPIVNAWIIASEMTVMKCLQLLKNTVQPFRSIDSYENIDDIVSILLLFRQCNFQCKHFYHSHQIEMLLECLWLIDRWEDCFYWCEIGLNESMYIWTQKKANNQPISKDFIAHIQYLTIYLQHILQQNNLHRMYFFSPILFEVFFLF